MRHRHLGERGFFCSELYTTTLLQPDSPGKGLLNDTRLNRFSSTVPVGIPSNIQLLTSSYSSNIIVMNQSFQDSISRMLEYQPPQSKHINYVYS